MLVDFLCNSLPLLSAVLSQTISFSFPFFPSYLHTSVIHDHSSVLATAMTVFLPCVSLYVCWQWAHCLVLNNPSHSHSHTHSQATSQRPIVAPVWLVQAKPDHSEMSVSHGNKSFMPPFSKRYTSLRAPTPGNDQNPNLGHYVPIDPIEYNSQRKAFHSFIILTFDRIIDTLRAQLAVKTPY